jgi:hypothetical protein
MTPTSEMSNISAWSVDCLLKRSKNEFSEDDGASVKLQQKNPPCRNSKAGQGGTPNGVLIEIIPIDVFLETSDGGNELFHNHFASLAITHLHDVQALLAVHHAPLFLQSLMLNLYLLRLRSIVAS